MNNRKQLKRLMKDHNLDKWDILAMVSTESIRTVESWLDSNKPDMSTDTLELIKCKLKLESKP